MTQSTADKIKSLLPTDNRYWSRGGKQYNGPAPYRRNSDSNALSIEFNGGEYGRYNDFVGKTGGSLYTLAKLLDIELPKESPARFSRKVKTLAEYEKDKYLPENHLCDVGWTQGEFMNRSCLFIPASDGTTQVRFLDTLEPRYYWTEKRNDKSLPFYGTQKAIGIAKENQLDFIVLVNGAGSVEACQVQKIPAFAVLGGESSFNLQHANNILNKYNGKVLVALDCDTSGRKASKNACQYLGERAIEIDFKGTDKFDAADFVALWQEQSLERLKTLSKQAYSMKAPTNAHEARQAILDTIQGVRKSKGRIVPQPFTKLHEYGGGAKWLMPNRLTGVLGLSGGGKTSWWHSLVMMLIYHPRKFGFIVDGREFLPETDEMRRIQMETQDKEMNYDAVIAHEVAMQEKDEGITYHHNGKLLSDENVGKIKRLNRNSKDTWQGHVEYATEYLYVEDTLDYMKRRTIELRANNTPIDIWIFDYLTLYKAKRASLEGKDSTIANVILDLIKAASRVVNVHSIVMLQPNKNPSAEQRSKNTLLKVTDMGYANPNHFNFIVGLNTLFGKKAVQYSNGDWLTRRGIDGEYEMGEVELNDGSFACRIEVLKNSFGKTGHKNIRGDLQHLRWLDKSWHEGDLRIAFTK